MPAHINVTRMNYKEKPLKIFLKYIGRQKKLFIIDMFCAAMISVVDLVFPYVSRTALNKYLPGGMYRAFFTVMGIIVLAYICKAFMDYAVAVLGHKMGVLVESDMRRDIFTHIQNLPHSFFDKNRTGALLSRVTTDLFDITELAHHGPENIIICTLTIIGSLVMMFIIEWHLAAVIAVALPLFLGIAMKQRVRMKKTNIEVKQKTAEIYSAIESGISGIRTSKAFANEDVEKEKFEEANVRYADSKKDFFKAMGLFTSSMDFALSILQVIVILVGGALIMKNKTDTVTLITFTLYVSSFSTPARKLSMFVEDYMRGAAGFTRFLEIMRTEPSICDLPGAETLENPEGRIEYKNVGFSYDGSVKVLDGINLTVNPGECLALVGPSGGGKTTVCHLLPRFYEVTAGEILIDGRDIRDFTLESLRKNIGIIQQDVFMFAGSIRDNIRYGRPDATDLEVVQAAMKAEIHDEIMSYPNGYDTYVGERGVMLSGGQKQRISIARVFLKNPKILILDEATSALDTVTEQRIQSSFDSLCEGRTTIIVAHRLSTIKKADRIAVIEEEHLAEEGTHEELMKRGGIYAELQKAQEARQ